MMPSIPIFLWQGINVNNINIDKVKMLMLTTVFWSLLTKANTECNKLLSQNKEELIKKC